jgi:hypothetical protein
MFINSTFIISDRFTQLAIISLFKIFFGSILFCFCFLKSHTQKLIKNVG